MRDSSRNAGFLPPEPVHLLKQLRGGKKLLKNGKFSKKISFSYPDYAEFVIICIFIPDEHVS